jgi:hypothetical protein
MHFSAVLSVAVLAQVSLADFYLFRVKAGDDYGYQISDVDNPNCEELGPRTPWYPAKSDVSGDKLGIRCDGDGCSESNVCREREPFGIAALTCRYTRIQ